MTIYKTPYGLVQLKKYNSIHAELVKMVDTGSDILKETALQSVFSIDPGYDGIDQFNFPMVVGDKVIVDDRYLRNSKGTIINSMEARLLARIAILELEWVESRESFASVIGPISSVYGTWVSSMLTSSFNRGAEDSLVMRIAFSLFCYSNFLPEEQNDELEQGKLNVSLLKMLSRNARIPSDFILDTMERKDEHGRTLVQALTGTKSAHKSIKLDILCDWLNDVMGTPIQEFSSSTISQITANGAWAGANARPLANIALYHPPVIAAMLEQASSYNVIEKRSRIAMAANAVKRETDVAHISEFVRRKYNGDLK